MSYTDVLDTEELLTKNCESAEKNLVQIAFDLDYLRDQMTITEVTMARLYSLRKVNGLLNPSAIADYYITILDTISDQIPPSAMSGTSPILMLSGAQRCQ